jgi:hypothetical protein
MNRVLVKINYLKYKEIRSRGEITNTNLRDDTERSIVGCDYNMQFEHIDPKVVDCSIISEEPDSRCIEFGYSPLDEAAKYEAKMYIKCLTPCILGYWDDDDNFIPKMNPQIF